MSTDVYVCLLHMLKNHESACLFGEQIVKVFKKAPKEIKQLTKMMRQFEEHRLVRKRYKDIIDIIGKENTTD